MGQVRNSVNSLSLSFQLRLIILVSGSISLLLAVSPHAQQQGNMAVSLYLDDPRPLARAVEALEKRFGWVITYEDPPFAHVNDLADVTASVRRDVSGSAKVLIPRGGSFAFSYDPPLGVPELDEETVLVALLDHYHLSGNPGVYRLLRSASAFHVVPSRVKNLQGVLESYNAVLDADISVPAGNRTAFEMIKAIVAAISQSTGVEVAAGTVPINLLMQTRVDGAAYHENARAVLTRVLEQTGRRLSWKLLYTPTPTKGYALNIHIVNVKADGSQDR
jgi:hypothetical protein